MRAILAILNLLLTVLSLPGMARADAPARPCPHWCEDLGISCRTFGMQESEEISKLNTTSPEQFLPVKIAEYVQRCEYARKQNNSFSLERLHAEENPLRGLIRHIEFVPAQLLKAAELPPSNSRVVVDCKGKHLQLKGAFKTDRQRFDFIKRTLNELIKSGPMLRALGSINGWFHPSSGTRVSVASCSMQELQHRPKPQIEISSWASDESGSIKITSIPKEFVAQECFRSDTVTTAPNDGPSVLKTVTTRPEYQESLRDIEDEVSFLSDYCNYMANTDAHYYNSGGLCLMDNEGQLKALVESFQKRLSPQEALKYELDMTAAAAGMAEKKLHEARAVGLRSYLLPKDTPTPTDLLAGYDELKLWCVANHCACRSSGTSQLLINGVRPIERNENGFTSAEHDLLLSDHSKEPDCDEKHDAYFNNGILNADAWR